MNVYVPMLKKAASALKLSWGTSLIAAVAMFTATLASGAEAAENQVTFAKDVVPILQRSCQSCHRPGQIGPFSMLTYEETRPWARAIKQQVVRRNMPPWFIDRTVGIHKFNNDISLSDAEIATISAWVDAGAPKGNPADMPPARVFDDGDRWHIGKPDIIVRLNKDVFVKAKEADQWMDIETQDLGLTTDRYVQAVEIKPLRGVGVVHHVTSDLIDPDSETGKTVFEEYAVGKYGNTFPEGSGMLLKKGAKILANVHLHANGTDTPVDIAFAIKLLPEGTVPKHVLEMRQLASVRDLDIPANTKNVRVDGYSLLTRPAVIVAYQPHMHNRGQAQCLELLEPQAVTGGNNRVTPDLVSCVDRFKFDWHVVYEYADDVAPVVPAGTIIHSITLHDNTSGNPSNPDPTNWVGWGQRTADEMAISWVSYYYISDEEYKQRIAERKAKNVPEPVRQTASSAAQHP